MLCWRRGSDWTAQGEERVGAVLDDDDTPRPGQAPRGSQKKTARRRFEPCSMMVILPLRVSVTADISLGN